jgi:hypothetical protein
MPESKSVECVIKRRDQARDRALSWWSLYEDAYNVTQPERSSYRRDWEGNVRGEDIFDSVGVSATVAFTAKLQSSLTPSYQNWQKLTAGMLVPEEERDGINEELEEITEIFFKYLNGSNFASASGEAYFDLAVGTAALYVTYDDDHPLIFRSYPISKMYFEEDSYGILSTVFHDYEQIPVRDIEVLWPTGKMSGELKRSYGNDPNVKANLLEASIFYPKEKVNKYRYIVIEEATKHVVLDSWSPSSPWIAFRWMKRPGQTLGVGPAIFARATLKTINAMAADELRSAAFKAGPMWLAFSDNVFNANKFDPEPGKVIEVGGLPGGAPPLQQLPTASDAQFTQLVLSDLREQVLKIMYADILRPVDAPPQTATETIYKKQVLLEQIGPAIGRLQVEFLPRLSRRIVYVLQKQGLFGRLLPKNFAIDGKIVDLQYTSPLSQAQSNTELESYQQFLELMNGTGGPEFTQNSIHIDKLPSWIAEKTGTPLSIVKTDAEVQADHQKAAEAAQGALQAQQAPGISGVPLPGEQQQQQQQQQQ